MTHSALKWILAALCACPAWLHAQRPYSGQVMMLTGQASAMGVDGSVRPLSKSQVIYAGDIVNTEAGSYVNLRFVDGGYLLLKPETRFQVEQFEAPPAVILAAAQAGRAVPQVTLEVQQAPERSAAVFRLFKGGFRAVTGLIGKVNREDYRVNTPVATIGIRGTKFGGDLCEGDCADRNEIDAELRRAGESPSDTVLITTVDEGEITVATPQGTQAQGPGVVLLTTQGGSVTPATQAPRSIQQDQTMQPESCGD